MDIISVNFETGAIVGSIDEFWVEEHKIREEKTMTRPGLDKAAFQAAADEGKNVSELSRLFNVSWQTAQKHFNKYREEKAALIHGAEPVPEDFFDNGCCEDTNPAPPTPTDMLSYEAKMALEPPADDFGTDTDVGTTAEDEQNMRDGLMAILDAITPDLVTEGPVTYIDPEWREVSVNVALDHRASLDQDIQCIDNLLGSRLDAVSDQMTFRIREALKQIQDDFQDQSDKITEALGKTKVVIWGMD